MDDRSKRELITEIERIEKSLKDLKLKVDGFGPEEERKERASEGFKTGDIMLVRKPNWALNQEREAIVIDCDPDKKYVYVKGRTKGTVFKRYRKNLVKKEPNFG